MSFRRPTRENRNTISDDFIVFIQGHKVNIGMMDDDLIRFHQAMESSNSQRWIDALNKVINSINDNDIWDFLIAIRYETHWS
ncbi:unnamed protein product [Trifolium pratense]|uniref:Uncharacterized protein n=1 Tax=Trifolium pratense TaxID=57577 RepID=A0ACB0JV51_TRIPR|nr:unnamed protein product [Trifolium pratense]